jgi:hypothetical protein
MWTQLAMNYAFVNGKLVGHCFVKSITIFELAWIRSCSCWWCVGLQTNTHVWQRHRAKRPSSSTSSLRRSFTIRITFLSWASPLGLQVPMQNSSSRKHIHLNEFRIVHADRRYTFSFVKQNFGSLFELVPAGNVWGPVKLVGGNGTAIDLTKSSWY